MSLKIIFDIFSGRPNPEMMLNDKDAKAFLDQLGLDKTKTVADAHANVETRLGYRGIIVEQLGAAQLGLGARFRIQGNQLKSGEDAFRIASASLENGLLAKTANVSAAGISSELAALIRSEASAAPAASGASTASAPSTAALLKCATAPIYEPAWWNDTATGGVRQYHNNCYNYACNYRTDTYAQPGRASGTSFTSISCSGMRPAVQGDGLARYSPNPVVGLQCPGKGELAAMVVWPNWDFHWYRLGNDGFWSHKPGSNPVTNLDDSGNVITDPRTANRGRYTEFCSFMVVMHGHVFLK